MRQSKKLWRKAAALVCSFALLMGSSLQAMPTMVISATDGESSTSEDSGSMEDENSNAAKIVLLMKTRIRKTHSLRRKD